MEICSLRTVDMLNQNLIIFFISCCYVCRFYYWPVIFTELVRTTFHTCGSWRKWRGLVWLWCSSPGRKNKVMIRLWWLLSGVDPKFVSRGIPYLRLRIYFQRGWRGMEGIRWGMGRAHDRLFQSISLYFILIDWSRTLF